MDFTRHSGIFDASDLSITLIGVGGIGSPTALVLEKMGVGWLTFYDDDDVDDVNIATQLHKLSDIGRPKVYGLEDTLLEFGDATSLTPMLERVGDEGVKDTIIVSAVDSITTRQRIWEVIACKYYIDARMAAEELHIFTVDMDDPESVAAYENKLMSLEEGDIPDLPCTSKATIYTGFVAAGMIGSTVRKLITGQEVPQLLTLHLPSNTLFALG
jgi:molybdopterin/thiamine biosynthesis adenylyltransferase